MKTFLIIVMLLLTMIVATGFQPQQPQAWEYKFEYKMNEKKANALGAEGWELTAIESTSSAGIATNVPTYVFKRAK